MTEYIGMEPWSLDFAMQPQIDTARKIRHTSASKVNCGIPTCAVAIHPGKDTLVGNP